MKTTEQLQFVDGTSISIISSKKISKNNKSGVRGVSFNKRTGKWVARLTFKRQVYCLGEYVRFEDAVNARKKKEKIFEDFIKEYQMKMSKK